MVTMMLIHGKYKSLHSLRADAGTVSKHANNFCPRVNIHKLLRSIPLWENPSLQTCCECLWRLSSWQESCDRACYI